MSSIHVALHALISHRHAVVCFRSAVRSGENTPTMDNHQSRDSENCHPNCAQEDLSSSDIKRTLASELTNGTLTHDDLFSCNRNSVWIALDVYNHYCAWSQHMTTLGHFLQYLQLRSFCARCWACPVSLSMFSGVSCKIDSVACNFSLTRSCENGLCTCVGYMCGIHTSRTLKQMYSQWLNHNWHMFVFLCGIKYTRKKITY